MSRSLNDPNARKGIKTGQAFYIVRVGYSRLNDPNARKGIKTPLGRGHRAQHDLGLNDPNARKGIKTQGILCRCERRAYV